MRHSALRLALGLLLLGGCAGPAAHFSDRAAALGLRAALVEGDGFHHVAYRRAERAAGAARALHIYLDGDGTPWAAGGPTADPTPRDPLVLRLMAMDAAPSVYLGRPCYHGRAVEPPCAPALWTDARYSEVVVASLAAAARRLLEEEGRSAIVWLGYSGGGTLAVLLAARVRETVGVVTVAANLDVEGWTRLHRQSPLDASLEPGPPAAATAGDLSAALRRRAGPGGAARHRGRGRSAGGQPPPDAGIRPHVLLDRALAGGPRRAGPGGARPPLEIDAEAARDRVDLAIAVADHGAVVHEGRHVLG